LAPERLFIPIEPGWLLTPSMLSETQYY